MNAVLTAKGLSAGQSDRVIFSGVDLVVSPGKVIGPNELWAGTPARLLRVMSPEERAKFDRNAEVYRELARRFRTGLSSTT